MIERHPKYRKAKILERLIEPELVIMFRVPWMDDSGEVQVNRGFRIEMNNAIGPYKGGLCFHPTVNLSILKFLAFEQVFKNSLITLPLGSGKGGVNINPKGKSDNEVMRFCQAFMSELFIDAKIHFGPGKAANAGGVAVSGLEKSQNSLRLTWTREEMGERLCEIMKDIHEASREAPELYGTPGNYINGANIAGFLKVAKAMLDQGLV